MRMARNSAKLSAAQLSVMSGVPVCTIRSLECKVSRSGRIDTLELLADALGRMGFRESKFAEFERVFSEVYQEYMESFADDLKDDKEMVYSRAVLDRELKQYTGKLFAPAEERYR